MLGMEQLEYLIPFLAPDSRRGITNALEYLFCNKRSCKRIQGEKGNACFIEQAARRVVSAEEQGSLFNTCFQIEPPKKRKNVVCSCKPFPRYGSDPELSPVTVK